MGWFAFRKIHFQEVIAISAYEIIKLILAFVSVILAVIRLIKK